MNWQPHHSLMRIGHGRWLIVASAFVIASGCSSSSGPISRRFTTMTALKTDVTRLESEKAQLQKEIGLAQTESHRLESQLAESESENNELASRLDDAKSVLARQGLDTSRLSVSRSISDDIESPTPKKSSGTKVKSRKPPMAEIPRDRRKVPQDEDLPLEDFTPSSKSASRDSFGPQSSRDDHNLWLPVARDTLSGRKQTR